LIETRQDRSAPLAPAWRSETAAPLRILLAEDDPVLGQALVTGLGHEGCSVQWLRDGIDAYAALQKDRPDALVLDIGLPGLSGLDLLHRLRQADTELPVIVISAYGETSDRIRGLDFGADDYLAKPFDLDELGARLRAMTRRMRGRGAGVVQIGTVEVDLRAHQARVDGEGVWLTGREFLVLKLLLERRGETVQREQIERQLYGWGEVMEASGVDMLIHHLRRKLGRDLIYTYRGGGYSIPR
jgi:two-component system response regulator QseB